MSQQAIVDFRSDFLARPTPAMVEAMVKAAVEPSGFGLREDKHQAALEARAAELLGKEDALFVPTCGMANQIAIHLFTGHGRAILCEERSHIITSEGGAPAALSGATLRTLPGRRGAMDLAALEQAALTPVAESFPKTGMIVIENTHVRYGGTILPEAHCAAVADIARRAKLPVHLDGARIFNAAIASGRPATDFTRHAVTVAASLNKGLCAPIGAVLAGPKELIEEAVRVRQMFGGGFRPVGTIAAAALVALNTMIARLAEDHARAKRLADGLANQPGLSLDPAEVETNLVVPTLTQMTPEAFCERLAKEGILAMPFGPKVVRFAIHNDIDDQAIERAIAAVARVLRKAAA
ncbi:MAG: aminotransferase class I/II-fold pyridoxal phosphate-dependent enzyme [Alphaproteobacteria bacterium]|nr:aminotransferase class I/II-fold pyridoxal phosphate-dependent enzyme [Alphaproteobacteria bacterium]